MAEMVDLNELRVSHEREILEVLDEDDPLMAERVTRMRQALNEVYRREHATVLKSIIGKGKKDQRSYLDTLPGSPPYVCAHVMLSAFGGHAIPVDSKLCALLAGEGVIDDENADPGEVESFLLRQIKASDAMHGHLVLQAWSDSSRKPSPKHVEAHDPPDPDVSTYDGACFRSSRERRRRFQTTGHLKRRG